VIALNFPFILVDTQMNLIRQAFARAALHAIEPTPQRELGAGAPRIEADDVAFGPLQAQNQRCTAVDVAPAIGCSTDCPRTIR